MVSVSHRSTVALAIGIGALIASQALLVSVPTSAASGSSCTELRRWAQASYRGTAPTLESLARYDRAHRVAIFNAVSPEVRSALWQEQLRRFDQRPDLTPTQHALIAEALTVATPGQYTHDPAAMKAYDALLPRVKEAFTSREHMLFLTNVGFTENDLRPRSQTLLEKLTSPFVANAAGAVCECFTGNGQNECGSGRCVAGGCVTVFGCGIIGANTCNGMCG
jgi:hypothetical protein